jgi:hypothetical protein
MSRQRPLQEVGRHEIQSFQDSPQPRIGASLLREGVGKLGTRDDATPNQDFPQRGELAVPSESSLELRRPDQPQFDEKGAERRIALQLTLGGERRLKRRRGEKALLDEQLAEERAGRGKPPARLR